MTELQSIKLLLVWPKRPILKKAAANLSIIKSWSSAKDCQVHAVRESRASSESDCKRIVPLIAVPRIPGSIVAAPTGKRAPSSRTSMKMLVSKTAGVESNGTPLSGGAKSSAPAAEWEARRATSSAGEKPTEPKKSKSSSVVLTG